MASVKTRGHLSICEILALVEVLRLSYLFLLKYLTIEIVVPLKVITFLVEVTGRPLLRIDISQSQTTSTFSSGTRAFPLLVATGQQK
jgi:hypothetical protein